MNPLREAAQQALEALENLADCGAEAWSEQRPCVQIGREAITALRAALAQQDESDHETRAELAEQQVVQLAEERDHYRNLWQKAQEQAEPLNLSDPAVQKRLASQWGYVPAAAQRDALLEVLKYLDKEFRQHGRQHWPEAVRVRTAIKTVEEGK